MVSTSHLERIILVINVGDVFLLDDYEMSFIQHDWKRFDAALKDCRDAHQSLQEVVFAFCREYDEDEEEDCMFKSLVIEQMPLMYSAGCLTVEAWDEHSGQIFHAKHEELSHLVTRS